MGKCEHFGIQKQGLDFKLMGKSYKKNTVTGNISYKILESVKDKELFPPEIFTGFKIGIRNLLRRASNPLQLPQ